MPLNTDQLAWLRSEVGTAPADDNLNARYDRLGSVTGVAVEVLRERRAKMLEQPLSLTVNGVATVNYSENIKALDRRLSALADLDEDPTDEPGEDPDGGAGLPDVEVHHLTRARGR